MKSRARDIDVTIADINMRAAIAFALLLIVFLLMYIAFWR